MLVNFSKKVKEPLLGGNSLSYELYKVYKCVEWTRHRPSLCCSPSCSGGRETNLEQNRINRKRAHGFRVAGPSTRYR